MNRLSKVSLFRWNNFLAFWETMPIQCSCSMMRSPGMSAFRIFATSFNAARLCPLLNPFSLHWPSLMELRTLLPWMRRKIVMRLDSRPSSLQKGTSDFCCPMAKKENSELSINLGSLEFGCGVFFAVDSSHGRTLFETSSSAFRGAVECRERLFAGI